MTAEDARQFWSAVHFYRRAPDRDQALAIRIIRKIATETTGPAQIRAAKFLKEIENGKPASSDTTE